MFGSPTIFVGTRCSSATTVSFRARGTARPEERMTNITTRRCPRDGVGPLPGRDRASPPRRLSRGDAGAGYTRSPRWKGNAGLNRSPCDVGDATALEQAIAKVGNPKVVVQIRHGAFGTLDRAKAPATSRSADGAIPSPGYGLTPRDRGGRRRSDRHRHLRAAWARRLAGFAPTAAQRILRNRSRVGTKTSMSPISSRCGDRCPVARAHADAADDFFISPASRGQSSSRHQRQDPGRSSSEIRLHERGERDGRRTISARASREGFAPCSRAT